MQFKMGNGEFTFASHLTFTMAGNCNICIEFIC